MGLCRQHTHTWTDTYLSLSSHDKRGIQYGARLYPWQCKQRLSTYRVNAAASSRLKGSQGWLYLQGKKTVMTQVDGGSEWGKLSLFNYWSISACSSACIRLTSATRGVLSVRLLWNALEGLYGHSRNVPASFQPEPGWKAGFFPFFFWEGSQCPKWALKWEI